MSTQQSSQGLNPEVAADLKRQAQSQQWRDIGISAVAAAAQQASDKRAAELKAAAGAERIVTLKDIDHLAA